VITHCQTSTTSEDRGLHEVLSRVDQRLVGQRYDQIQLPREEDARIGEVVKWLRESV
jgi:hypothetical protein